MTVLRASAPRASAGLAARLAASLAALCVLLPALATEAPPVRTATAKFWSADARPAACRQGRVEMIVGGDPTADDCNRRHGVDAAALPAATQARVEPAVQRARDGDRRAILLRELEREQAELAQLQSAPAHDSLADALLRTRENVAALQRELARTP